MMPNLPSFDEFLKGSASLPSFDDFLREKPKPAAKPVSGSFEDEFGTLEHATKRAAEFGGMPFSKMAGLPSATELYEKGVEGLKSRWRGLPPEIQKRPEMQAMRKTGAFAAEVGKAVPEVVDFVQSPSGLQASALIGGVGGKAATAIGAGISAVQAPSAARSVKEAVDEPTAENVGRATKETLLTAAPLVPAFMRRGKPKVSETRKPSAAQDFSAAAADNPERGSFSRKPVEPKPVEEEFLNFGRIKVSPTEEQLLRGTLRGMADRGELVKDVEPHAAIIAEAAKIDPSLVREVSMEGGIQGRAARQIIRERINALGREITNAGEQLKQSAMTADERAPLEKNVERMEADLKQYLTNFAGIRTEAGRNLAALKIMARNTLDLDWWVAEAKRSNKIPQGAELPEAKLKAVRQKVAAAQQAASSGDVAAAEVAKSDLSRTVAQMRENGWLETGVALWRAGLLTGVKTHARNVGGNVIFGAMEEASRLPASLVDMAISLKTERRTTAGMDPMAMVRATADAATRGVREAKEIMQRGASQADLAKGEMQREWNFQGLPLPKGNDLINRYINLVGRTLGAEDKIAKVYALRRSLEAQAYIQATNESKARLIPKQAVQTRTRELVANPTEKLTAEAIAYADFVTFNNENALANAIGRGASALGPMGKAVVGFELPFRRTPFNIFNRLMDYTPVGAVVRPALEAHKASRAGQAFDAQRVVSEAFGRGMVGTGMLALGWYLGKEGLATGTGQEEPAKRNVQKAAGRIPGAVMSPISDDWLKVASFAPGGALIQIGAQLAREQARSLKDEMKRPANVAKVATRAIMEQPMLQSMRETVEALENPDSRAENLAASRAGSFVPAIVNDIATLTNPERIETQPPKHAGIAGAAAHGVQSRLPFLKGKLPAAADVFGRPLDASRGNAVNPLTPSTAQERTDPLMKELLASDIGIGGIRQAADETADEFRARRLLMGAVMENALREELAGLPPDPEERKTTMQQVITSAQRNMTKYLKSEDFKALSPAEKIAEMTELAATYR